MAWALGTRARFTRCGKLESVAKAFKHANALRRCHFVKIHPISQRTHVKAASKAFRLILQTTQKAKT
jgi:hypothetical protein